MKNLFALLISGLFIQTSFCQNFYDITQVEDIKIYFGFSNWDYRMDTAIAGSESYTTADSVVINGTTFLSCGVKYKGNSSYSASRAKNPLHIKLDYNLNQDYHGYEDLKLSSGFGDPSMVREVLSYQIARQYMDAPLSNLAKVYINGAYYGIMANCQDVNSKFLEDHYYSSRYTFIKCNPQNVGGSGSNLSYLGSTSTSYETQYELKSGTWQDLINVCDTLNNASAAFPSIADIDRFIWMLAFNNVLVNLDSYSGNFRQNYYMYKNHDNYWIPTLWDLNQSFGSFSQAGGSAGNLNTAGEQTMTPLLHKTETGWPLIYYLLNNTMYEKMYIAHMRTINNENFATGTYQTTANALHSLADPAVSSDANYLYTYTQFQNSFTTGVMMTGPGIFQLMDARATYLAGTTQFGYTPPTITAVTPSSATPAYGSNVDITCNVTNATAVYLGYRQHHQDQFTRIVMYDDGAHNDGGSGDNVYGISIPVNSLEIQYYIYADNATAGMFSPERAEHEFYSLNPTITMATTSDIVINEFLAMNATGILNEDGNSKDWIEIYNTTNNALGLGNLFLTDSTGLLTRWQFPSNALILPYEHLLIWADDKDVEFLDLHTNFNLASDNESVAITNGTSLGDYINYNLQADDVSMARCADGSGALAFNISPTPRAANNCNVGIEDAEALAIQYYPNPTTDYIYYQTTEGQEIKSIYIISMTGQTIDVTSAQTSQMIPVGDLAAGIYTLRFVTTNNLIYQGKFVKL
jgi:hypothetical protein